MTPWSVSLPTALTVGGKEYAIRSDYRVALDILLALTDVELSDTDKALEAIECLYVDEIPAEHLQEALEKCYWFIRGGEEVREQNQPRLVSWEQDFNLIAAPISKVVGQDIRGMEYLHWWTFLSAYMGIGDCLFAQIVGIRDKKARGKALDKVDREFYRRNRDLIDMKTKTTEAEDAILNSWI